MATPDTKDLGRIEHEIAQVRDDLGRTVAEIGARLTPAHLMEQAKQGLKDSTVNTTRAVAESAADFAGDVATRTRAAAMGARDQAQAHPYTAGAIGMGIGLGYWMEASARRNRRRLVPREWDQPFDRSSRRRPSSPVTMSRALPLAAGIAAALLLWRVRP